jgi:hypothetical protein
MQEMGERAAAKCAARREQERLPPVSKKDDDILNDGTTTWQHKPLVHPSRNGKATGLTEGNQRTWLKKGQGGRRPGTPNKVTSILKEAILLAAEQSHPAGLTGYLMYCAKHERKAYLSLLSKLLPYQVAVDKYSEAVYKSYQEVNVALGDAGLSLPLIEKLKKIDVSAPDGMEQQQDYDGKKADAPDADTGLK